MQRIEDEASHCQSSGFKFVICELVWRVSLLETAGREGDQGAEWELFEVLGDWEREDGRS